ncbi:MAG: aminodeoxychorismate lyase [Gammaproteobacteria bacterium]|nr:aminodeoxychorismate lyase [Gammaproteobacteria bacterium]
MSLSKSDLVPKFLINGYFGDNLPVTDRGLQYGDGLFETIKVHQGRPLLWSRHIKRLNKGCERLKIACPAESILAAETDRFISPDLDAAILKIIITRGSGQRGYKQPVPLRPTRIIALYPYPGYPESHQVNGVSLKLCVTPLACNPILAGLKHLNRLEQVLATTEWHDDIGIVDGIMKDVHGNVIETTMANLFIVSDQALYTPDLSQCGVAGVMRGKVLELAKELQLTVSERPLTETDVLNADEVFITNSLNGIWPVNQIEQTQFVPGQITRQLIQQLHLSWK